MVDWTIAQNRLQARDLTARCAEGPVGCPLCAQRYRFGDACPSCDVLLVPADLIDDAPPLPDATQRPRMLALWQVFRVMAPAGLAALGLMSWLVNHGILSLPTAP